MAAAPQLTSTPIVVIGDCGVPFDALQRQVLSSSTCFINKAPSLLDAFQTLIDKGRGILFVRLEEKKYLAEFAKIFQVSVRQLNITQITIIICSTKDEILSNKALTQFPFIKMMKPMGDFKALATHLTATAEALTKKNVRRKNAKQGISSKIIVIKGAQGHEDKGAPIIQERATDRGHQIITGTGAPVKKENTKRQEDSTEWLPVPELIEAGDAPAVEATSPKEANIDLLDKNTWTNFEDKNREEILEHCLGPTVPTFIYCHDLGWRVRGFFKEFHPQKNEIIFQVSHMTGAEKLKSEILKSNYSFYSSTSTPKARVCTTLNYIEQKGLEFKFKTPESVQGVQRRANQRARISPEFPVIIQYFDERIGADRTLNVIDISTGGMGLRLDKDFVKEFEVGRRIANVSLFFFNRVIRIPEFEIRHCSKSDVNPDFKIMGVMMSGVTQTDLNFVEMFVLSETSDNP